MIVSRWGDQSPGLFYMSMDGDSIVRLSATPRTFVADRLPRLGPAGKRLAFVRVRNSGVSDLYVLDVEKPDVPLRITYDHRRIDGLGWTPDGEHLLFTSNRGGNSHVWRIAVRDSAMPRRVPISGRNASNLSVSASGVVAYEEYSGDSNIWEFSETGLTQWTSGTRSEFAPRYSPNGHQVAYLSDQTGSAEIWVANTDGRNAQRVSSLEGAAVDPPRWATDGESLLYAAAPMGDFDLFRISPATREPIRITEGPGDDRLPSQLSDDGSLLFASNRSGSWQLWVSSSTGDVMQLTTSGGFASQPISSSSVFVTKPRNDGLWRFDRITGGEELIWPDVHQGDAFNWSVVGDRVYYLQVANTLRPTLRMLDLTTGEETSLSIGAAEAPTVAGVDGTVNGDRILYSRVDASESDLWFMTLNLAPGS